MSRYIESLPAWLRADPVICAITIAFERILSGLPAPIEGVEEPDSPGVEAILERAHTYFRPGPGESDSERTPAHFLPWLARFVAAGLRDDWDEETKRRMIAQAIPLYRLRGTQEGLRKMIEIYVGIGDTCTIYEFENIPHFFQVEITLPQRDPDILARTDRAVRALIAQEKPAHTFYGLRFYFPSLQIDNDPQTEHDGIYVGVNTLLGNQAHS